MTLDDIKPFLAEHYSNYAVAVIDEDTGVLEYRYSNEMIGKMLFKEAHKDMDSYDADYDYEVAWEDEDEEE